MKIKANTHTAGSLEGDLGRVLGTLLGLWPPSLNLSLKLSRHQF